MEEDPAEERRRVDLQRGRAASVQPVYKGLERSQLQLLRELSQTERLQRKIIEPIRRSREALSELRAEIASMLLQQRSVIAGYMATVLQLKRLIREAETKPTDPSFGAGQERRAYPNPQTLGYVALTLDDVPDVNRGNVELERMFAHEHREEVPQIPDRVIRNNQLQLNTKFERVLGAANSIMRAISSAASTNLSFELGLLDFNFERIEFFKKELHKLLVQLREMANNE